MTRMCPDCGSPVEYTTRTAVILEGSCSGCGHSMTVVQGVAGPPGATPAEIGTGGAAEGERGDTAGESGWTGPRPACATCGSPLTFRVAGTALEGICSSCGRTSEFLPRGASPREFRTRPGPRFEGPARGRQDFGPARARPCRECGGPLQFSTAPDGTITGECAQCGNRFSLPPRGEPRGPRGAGGRRFDRGQGARFEGGRTPRRYGRPTGGRYGGRPRGEGRYEEDEDRPRRRPRRE